MNIKLIALAGLAMVLTACGDDKPAKTDAKLRAEQRADNPLLKLQDDSVNKVKNSVNAAAEQQKAALDNIDK